MNPQLIKSFGLISSLLLCAVFAPPAFAWWIFNDAVEIVEKMEKADLDRRAAYDPRASVDERLEAFDRAQKSTQEALNKTRDTAQEIPGIPATTGSPPTSKAGVALEVIKEAIKWAWALIAGEDGNGDTEQNPVYDANVVAQSNGSTFPPPPDDNEILDSISDFSILAEEEFLLEFDYEANPGFAPLLFGKGTFSGFFQSIESDGMILTAEDLIYGDVGISYSGLLDVLLPAYAAQSPSWDTGNYLSSPELYSDAFTVYMTESNESGEFSGEFFYIAVGPFVEAPEPPAIFLLVFGCVGMWLVLRRSNNPFI